MVSFNDVGSLQCKQYNYVLGTCHTHIYDQFSKFLHEMLTSLSEEVLQGQKVINNRAFLYLDPEFGQS